MLSSSVCNFGKTAFRCGILLCIAAVCAVAVAILVLAVDEPLRSKPSPYLAEPSAELIAQLDDLAANEGRRSLGTSLSMVTHARPLTRLDNESLVHLAQWLLRQPPAADGDPADMRYCRALRLYSVGAAVVEYSSFDAELTLSEALAACEAKRPAHALDDSDPDRFDELAVKAAGQLGMLYARRGMRSRSERAFRASIAASERLLARHPENDAHESSLVVALVALGDLYASGRRPMDGRKAYERAQPLMAAIAARHPDVLECHTMLAEINGARARLADGPDVAVSLMRESIDCLQSVVARFPDEERPMLLLVRQSGDLFGLLLDAERYAEAVACASTGVSRASEAEAQFPTASMRTEYQHALQRSLLIDALCPVEELRDPQRALAAARTLAERESASTFGHTAMAVAYNAAGDWQAAIEAAKSANQKQNDPANLFCLAVAYQQTGQNNLARQAYESAVDLLAQADDEVVSKIYQLQRREAERVLRIEV